jgi:sortase A
MGKRSDRRKFRRRRRWAGFILLVSFALVVFGVQLLNGIGSRDLQTAASRTAEKGDVEKVKSPDVAGAPEAVGKQSQDKEVSLASEEEDVKTPAEKSDVEKQAARQADEKQQAERQANDQAKKTDNPQQASLPDPPTDDLWFSIPALGLYDQYVTNTNDYSALDYGAIKLPSSGFPWQKGANTYIAGHRLGYPDTGSFHIFYDLDKMAQGDEIILKDSADGAYVYQVTKQVVVDPDDVEVMNPMPNNNLLTLQTCTLPAPYTHRIIVQGELVKEEKG